jgi:hypothetical protein
MSSPPLIAIGYWHSLLEPWLPDPAWFVDAAWAPAERQQVLAYLQQGREIIPWMGFSWCRFRCEHRAHMGNSELTDGTYCWPEGLAHYIEAHQLRLPDQVVQHILTQTKFPVEHAAAVPELNQPSYAWWLSQKGWQPDCSSFLSSTDEEERAYLRRHERGQLDFNDHSAVRRHAREQMAQRLWDKFNPSK